MRVLIKNDALLQEGIQKSVQKYNTQQFITATLGEKQVSNNKTEIILGRRSGDGLQVRTIGWFDISGSKK